MQHSASKREYLDDVCKCNIYPYIYYILAIGDKRVHIEHRPHIHIRSTSTSVFEWQIHKSKLIVRRGAEYDIFSRCLSSSYAINVNKLIIFMIQHRNLYMIRWHFQSNQYTYENLFNVMLCIILLQFDLHKLISIKIHGSSTFTNCFQFLFYIQINWPRINYELRH